MTADHGPSWGSLLLILVVAFAMFLYVDRTDRRTCAFEGRVALRLHRPQIIDGFCVRLEDGE